MSPVNLAEFNADAAHAAELRSPVVDIKRDNKLTNLPSSFGEAYVPVLVGQKPVAVVAAYVDEKEASGIIYSTFVMAVITLCLLVALAFGVPAIAWYRRTREKQQADRRIQFLAHHDPLTGLANRARLIERLEAALATLPATGGMIALHFLDIDHFKKVNDALGHDAGDFLLSAIGGRLSALVRLEDFVARLGGDEFVVVQTGALDKAKAEAFAERIGTIYVSKSALLQGAGDRRGATRSASRSRQPTAQTPERLLKSADLALYAGKAAGRNCIRFFAPEMDEALQRRIALEKVIRDAVASNGLRAAFPAGVRNAQKVLVGFEALVRLPAPDGTLIPPETFIPRCRRDAADRQDRRVGAARGMPRGDDLAGST